MRIVSMEKGDDVKSIISRFSLGTQQIQKVLKENNADFMHSEHLGWILTCPSNLGTGLRAGCMVSFQNKIHRFFSETNFLSKHDKKSNSIFQMKIPNLSARADFKQLMGKMGLQARGSGGVDSASTGKHIYFENLCQSVLNG